MVTCSDEYVDMWFDEQTSLYTTIDTVDPYGNPLPLENVPISLVAYDKEMVLKIAKTVANKGIVYGPVYSTQIVGAVDNSLVVQQVSGFGKDNYGRQIPDMRAGDTVRVSKYGDTRAPSAVVTIDHIDVYTSTQWKVFFTTALGFSGGSVVPGYINQIPTSVGFQLNPSDTTLSPTKHYGYPEIWNYTITATWPGAFSAGNIYQAPNTLVIARGRFFIMPILDMS
jgi:hypothetical protein